MMSKKQAAAAYARFSTEMQREESIDAQLRAIREYAQRNNMTIIGEYIDRAKSATSDKRPEFQRMIRDAASGKFDAVIVHKLDRFARDRYDSAHYKFQLKRSGVTLRSVTENLDGSPESIVSESVLEQFILKSLADKVFNPESLPRLLSAYNSYALTRNEAAASKKRRLETQLADIDTQISNIVEVVAKTASTALLDKLGELERDKEQLHSQMDDLSRELSSLQLDDKTLKALFLKAKRKFAAGGLKNNRDLIDKYVDRVVIYPEHVQVYFNIGDRERQGSYDNRDALNHLSNLLTLKADRREVLGVAGEIDRSTGD